MFNWTSPPTSDSDDDGTTDTSDVVTRGAIPRVDSEEDERIEELISKLIWLSKIREGDKIDTQNHKIMSNGWLAAIWRTLIATGESRDRTYDFVRFTISTALANIEHMPPESLLREQLIDSLKRSFIGLRKLKVTYRDDTRFLSRVETLITRAEMGLKAIRLKDKAHLRAKESSE